MPIESRTSSGFAAVFREAPTFNINRLVELANASCGSRGVPELMRRTDAVSTTHLDEAIAEWQQSRAQRSARNVICSILNRTGVGTRQALQQIGNGSDLHQAAAVDQRARASILESVDRGGSRQLTALQAAATLWRMEAECEAWRVSPFAASEKELISQYDALIAGIKFDVDGKCSDLSAARSMHSHPDRDVRYKVRLQKWQAIAEHSQDLLRLFDQLVRIRSEGAKALGYRSYVALAHQLRKRSPQANELIQVAASRVEEATVPDLVLEKRRQAERLGLDRLMFWDESAPEPNSPPFSPVSFVELGRMLDVLSRHFVEFDDLCDALISNGLIHLAPSASPRAGAFCTGIATIRLPVVFCPFDGSAIGCAMLLHELGHAYQRWLGRFVDYPDTWAAVSPHNEICAVYFEQQSLRILSEEFDERLRDALADKARQARSLAVYAAAINCYEIQVYEQPDMTADDRLRLWSRLEERFMPWRVYADIPLARAGGLWLDQRHLFQKPLYFVDYCIAAVCELALSRSGLNRDSQSAHVSRICKLANISPLGDLLDELS